MLSFSSGLSPALRRPRAAKRRAGLSGLRRAALALGALAALAALFGGDLRAAGSLPAPLPVEVAVGNADRLQPSVSGELVVWEEFSDGDYDVYAKDLASGTVAPVTEAANDQRRPRISGNLVVWTDFREGTGEADVYAKDLGTGVEVPVATGAADQRRPDVDGSLVVWEEDRGAGYKLYGRDLESGASVEVSTTPGDKRRPDVSGELVVWEDDRQGTGTSDVYAKDLASGREFPVESAAAYADAPTVSGTTVVWRQEGTGSDDLYARDLSGGGAFPLATTAADEYSPAASGKLVVWSAGRDGAVLGRDLQTGEEFAVSPTGGGQLANPALSGELVVWEAQRGEGPNLGRWDLLGARLDTAPARPERLRAAAEPGGVRLVWDANPERDLAGYEVYRAASAEGPFERLGSGPTLAPEYLDAEAPRGEFSHYRVVALDAGAQRSAPALSGAVPFAVGTSLSAGVGRTTLTYGEETTVSGSLVHSGGGVSGREVVLEGRTGSGDFAPVARGLTGPDGGYAFGAVRPEGHTGYRVRFAGEGGYEPSVSATRSVRVRASVSTALSATRVRAGRPVVISGEVRPAHEGVVTVAVRGAGRKVLHRTVYLERADGGAALEGSRYRFVYRPVGVGEYTVSVHFPGDADHLGASGPVRTFRVVR